MNNDDREKLTAIHDCLLGEGTHKGHGVLNRLDDHESRIKKQEGYVKTVAGGFGLFALLFGTWSKIKGLW